MVSQEKTPVAVDVVDIGQSDYEDAWKLQRHIFAMRTLEAIPDALLLTEHNHVFTFGKASDDNHLLSNESELQKLGARVYHIDRGGDVTYHGPGQLVGYPILDLARYYCDLHRYLRDLEEIIIRTLAEYGIEGKRDTDFTGVWVKGEKIAAIGVKASRWITMHGFAFNINTNLQYFDRIIPCGIFHKGVTSMRALLGREVSLGEVSRKVVRHFGEVFGAQVRYREKNEYIDWLNTFGLETSEWVHAVSQ